MLLPLLPLVLVALHTGLRAGDLFSLEWSHINLERGQVTKVINKTRRKTVKPVTLPLRNDAVAVLKDWRAQSRGGGLVFPSPVTGKKIGSVKTAWRNLMAAADIQDFRFHDLRHTFASWLVMQGASLFTVQKLMTHSSAEMTQVYAHLSDDHLRQAVECRVRIWRAFCARVLSMTSWSSIQAMTLTDPPQRLQTSMSILNTRLSRWAQVIAA